MAQSGAEMPHVMISYQWDAQERMLKLRDELTKAGYDVWMDVDQMEGNMDVRMAEAVEQASAVLVCFPKKYQDSQNCRKEAQYAQSLQKHIIPLKYEDHKPTSWLGLMINALLYYDVQTEEAMMKSLPNVIRAFDKRGVSRRFGSSGKFDSEPRVVSAKSTSESFAPSSQQSESHEPLEGFSIINREDVLLGEILGTGGFGAVHLASHKHWGDVAVKQFRSLISEDVRREAEKMWRAISSPYLVRIMGIIDDPQHLSIVMEYFENGNLKDFRHKFMNSDACLARKVRMILDMSLGMNYLHTLKPPILHRDVKLSNIFVGNGFGAKIGDLGLAINKKSSSEVDSSAGTCTHLPPEAWTKSSAEPKEPFDIYTFGITLHEFLSGQEPWPAFATAHQISLWVQEGNRPDLGAIPSNTPAEIITIMKESWSPQPNDRPSFQEIQKRMSGLYNQDHKAMIRTADQTIIGEMSKAEQATSKQTDKTASGGGASGRAPVRGPRTQATPLSDSGIGISDLSVQENPTAQVVHQLKKVLEFGTVGDGPSDFTRARGIAVSPNSDIIIADPSKKAVLVFSGDGQHKFNLKSPKGKPEGKLRTPHDVAVSSQGKLMVVDLTKFVKIFDADGKYLQSFFTSTRAAPDEKIGTYCIDMDNQGEIIIGNYESKTITIHDAIDGAIKDQISPSLKPNFLAVNNQQQIIIGDPKAKKVCVIDYSGKEILTIDPVVDGAPCIPLGVACNASDDIFVAVVKINKSGKGKLNTGCILQYSKAGLFMGCVAKDLYYPMGMTFVRDRLAVANYNSCVVLDANQG